MNIADDDQILSSYVCLQLYTTRNMRPGIFIDWLWGGLNYQIEHHLFPSMPRHNLKTVHPFFFFIYLFYSFFLNSLFNILITFFGKRKKKKLNKKYIFHQNY